MIHERLKLAVSNASLSQLKVAESLQITRPYVTSLLNGTRSPSLDLAIRLAKLTGVSLSWLLTGEGNMLLTDEPETVVKIKEENFRLLSELDKLRLELLALYRERENFKLANTNY